jgi:hypothetical protein
MASGVIKWTRSLVWGGDKAFQYDPFANLDLVVYHYAPWSAHHDVVNRYTYMEGTYKSPYNHIDGGDLAMWISNHNGRLTCFGHQGTKTDKRTDLQFANLPPKWCNGNMCNYT